MDPKEMPNKNGDLHDDIGVNERASSQNATLSASKIAADDMTHNDENFARSVSLYDRLQSYSRRGIYPFCMPGHKRNPSFGYLTAAELDITEVEGFDNLNDPKGVLMDAQKLAAEVFSTRETRFSVSGSTVGILASVLAVTHRGDKIIIARNCHKSVFNAVELAGLNVVFVNPVDECDFFGEVPPSVLQQVLSENQDAKAVVITSPTYEGVISDIAALAHVCRSAGALLIVDEAHGAHLGFDGFDDSARTLGADIVVNSLHKTLPSLTQTAVLHVCSDRIDVGAIDGAMSALQTSSPSYLLMASIDGCVRFLRDSEDAIAAWRNSLIEARRRLANLTKIRLYRSNCRYDVSKFVFLLDDAGITGPRFADMLRQKNIEIEMAGLRHVIAMSGAGDTAESLGMLVNAVIEIDKELQKRTDRTQNAACQKDGFQSANDIHTGSEQYLSCAVAPSELMRVLQRPICSLDFSGDDRAFAEEVPLASSVGRISAEHVYAYPPGCPILMKGEMISQDIVDMLVRLNSSGVEVSSSCRTFPRGVRVKKA